jgi:uncharacterized protein
MTDQNQKIVEKFFEAYSKHDMEAIRMVMSDNVKWYFNGTHPYAGTKNGIDEVVKFFDTMGSIMKKSNPGINKLIVASNEKYFIECQHIQTNRTDGINISHFACVLWTIENGKITEGRHFFANPVEVNKYFTDVARVEETGIPEK